MDPEGARERGCHAGVARTSGSSRTSYRRKLLGLDLPRWQCCRLGHPQADTRRRAGVVLTAADGQKKAPCSTTVRGGGGAGRENPRPPQALGASGASRTACARCAHRRTARGVGSRT